LLVAKMVAGDVGGGEGGEGEAARARRPGGAILAEAGHDQAGEDETRAEESEEGGRLAEERNRERPDPEERAAARDGVDRPERGARQRERERDDVAGLEHAGGGAPGE